MHVACENSKLVVRNWDRVKVRRGREGRGREGGREREGEGGK